MLSPYGKLYLLPSQFLPLYSHLCFYFGFTLASTLHFTPPKKAKIFDLEGEEKIEMAPGALEFFLWILLGQGSHLEGNYLRRQDKYQQMLAQCFVNLQILLYTNNGSPNFASSWLLLFLLTHTHIHTHTNKAQRSLAKELVGCLSTHSMIFPA